MKTTCRIIWGTVLVIVGVIFALNTFGVTDINIFFDGWWTLFIIVPSVIGLFTDNDKLSSLFWIAVGALLLLWRQNIIEIGFIFKLIWPALIIFIGLKLIFGNRYHSDFKRIKAEVKTDGRQVKEVCAAFSSQNIDYSGEVFQGAELTAIFGGIKSDLSNAVIQKDCIIEANAVFGGIEITLPSNVNVKVNANSVFGGTSDKTARSELVGAPTVFVNGNAVFGGVTLL